MPYDTKEHLISYHTEGQGEDRDVPVLNDDERDFGYSKGAAGAVGAINGMGMGGMAGMGGMGGMAGIGGMGGGFIESTSTMGGRGYNGMEMYNMNSMRNSGAWAAREMGGDFDGMAAPEMFLNEYYSQKSRAVDDGFARSNIVIYQNEGMGSPAGSVGCCSLLEDDNDLAFLSDLGPKFNTLAEICGGKKTTVEHHVPLPPPPKPVERSTENLTINRAVSSNTVNMSSNIASTTHMENMVVTENRPTMIASMQPTQTLLVQQQPMYYMVEPQPSTVLVAERPAMQNMYVLNSAPMAEEVVVQGANVTAGHGERMVFLERGGSTQALNAGMIHTGTLSGSQVLLVDGGAQSGHILQGTLPRGATRSQSVMIVEGGQGGVVQGSLKKGASAHGVAQGVVYGGSGVVQGSHQKAVFTAGSINGNVGLSGSTLRNPTTQKVVIQEKKVVTSQTIK